MTTKKLWKFPVPSTAIRETKLICSGTGAQLLFSYDDIHHNDVLLHSGITFDMPQAYRHSSEAFVTSLMDAYDYLVEVEGSEWVAGMKKTNPRIADFWKIKHYAIFLKSNGLFEFIARGFKMLGTEMGPLT